MARRRTAAGGLTGLRGCLADAVSQPMRLVNRQVDRDHGVVLSDPMLPRSHSLLPHPAAPGRARVG